MLLYRVLSALVGAPVFLFIIWYGQGPLVLMTGILIAVGLWEFSNMMKKGRHSFSLGISLVGSLIFLLLAYLDKGEFLGLAFTLVVMAVLLNLILKYPGFSLSDTGLTLFGIFYVGWLLIHLYLLRALPGGLHYAFLVITSTWATDTAAYFTGRSLGTIKLAPTLSPKKTLEGAAGGIVGALLAAFIASFYGSVSFYHYIVLGLLIGIFGQVGDLIESGIKRLAGVKDSGTLIPGHGGVLDRFDSILLTAPLVYYYVLVFILN